MLSTRDRDVGEPVLIRERAAPGAELRTRTLTNLYYQRPTWLDTAHRQLDEAVFAAYGWPADLTNQEILARLLRLNHVRAAGTPAEINPAH